MLQVKPPLNGSEDLSSLGQFPSIVPLWGLGELLCLRAMPRLIHSTTCEQHAAGPCFSSSCTNCCRGKVTTSSGDTGGASRLGSRVYKYARPAPDAGRARQGSRFRLDCSIVSAVGYIKRSIEKLPPTYCTGQSSFGVTAVRTEETSSQGVSFDEDSRKVFWAGKSCRSHARSATFVCSCLVMANRRSLSPHIISELNGLMYTMLDVEIRNLVSRIRCSLQEQNESAC